MNYKVAVIPGDGIGADNCQRGKKGIRQGWTEIWS